MEVKEELKEFKNGYDVALALANYGQTMYRKGKVAGALETSAIGALSILALGFVWYCIEDYKNSKESE